MIGFEKEFLFSPSLEDYARLTQEKDEESVDKDVKLAAKDAQVAALLK